MADRFWWAASLGAFAGHSETILQAGVPDDEQRLWWSKGGELRGTSPPRIQWFRDYFARLRSYQFRLADTNVLMGCAGRALIADGKFALIHLRTKGRCTLALPQLPPGELFRVTLINWWTMTTTVLLSNASNGTAVQVGEYGRRLPCNLELQSASSETQERGM